MMETQDDLFAIADQGAEDARQDQAASRESIHVHPRLVPAIRFALKVIQETLVEERVPDGFDLQDWAEEVGFIKGVPYDADEHGETSCDLEEGDTFYLIQDFDLLRKIEEKGAKK